MDNILLLSDSYKTSHYNMYPENTEYVYSYFESRGGAKFDHTQFVGMRSILEKYLAGQVVTQEKIDYAEKFINAHMGGDVFNREGWEHILNEHNGRLPLRIDAVEEGSCIPESQALITVVNTDPKCWWLTNYVETLLSQIWYACTVATKSRYIKQMCKRYLEITGCSLDNLNFMLHDFGFRGASSVESAQVGGAAHLTNFWGTDTMPAIQHIMDYYGVEDMPAFSVPATEHSIMTAEGPEGEKRIFKKLLLDHPTGILSIVIDSFDYGRFISVYSDEFKDIILARDGKVVFRPDSGNPVDVTLDCLYRLSKVFGRTADNKEYAELNPKVGVLWGDGINEDDVENILSAMQRNYWAASNIIFGMGGGLLQNLNRDTQRFAFKSSAQCRNGQWYDVYKDPIDSSKASKRGQVRLYKDLNGDYMTLNRPQYSDYIEKVKSTPISQMHTVFSNGRLVGKPDFNRIRMIADNGPIINKK